MTLVWLLPPLVSTILAAIGVTWYRRLPAKQASASDTVSQFARARAALAPDDDRFASSR